MSYYFDEVCRAMNVLACHSDTVFMGQSVECEGTAMFRTLRDVPASKRRELPVAEDMQMGMAIGAALAGALPITIYPRINFMLLAINQLVLHLDKFDALAGFQPTVIIRTGIAGTEPMHPGPQHIGDYSGAVEAMLSTVKVVRLRSPQDIVPAYTAAAARKGATLLIEYLYRY